MAGIPPLVVGSGEVARTKLRILLKRAPVVAVSTDEPAQELAELVEKGRVLKIAGQPTDAEISGRPLVIAATGNAEEDARTAAIARRIGVPVNVPDRPALSTFSLGAIVDRGSLTIAIGTDGAAPMLATEIRARLEMELDPGLGSLADLARDYRPRAAQKIPAGAERRAFWTYVLSGPVREAVLAGNIDGARALIDAKLDGTNTPQPQDRPTGRVILVGAGPGDPDLLTVKAVRAIKSADVILHDGLMGEGVLELARREAELISVAKAKGRHSMPQSEINRLIVKLARDGKTVVRLKGGDPSIFGRGGEEIDMARASGIPVEVIPGITAASAAAASLQIPLTQRGISRSLTFISGHAAGDGAPEFDQADFAALAGRGATLAVYMGLATAPVLARQLLESGWSPATPVLAIARVTQQGERRIGTTLDVLAHQSTGIALTGPVLIIIGEVASLDPAGEIDTLDNASINEREHANA